MRGSKKRAVRYRKTERQEHKEEKDRQERESSNRGKGDIRPSGKKQGGMRAVVAIATTATAAAARRKQSLARGE